LAIKSLLTPERNLVSLLAAELDFLIKIYAYANVSVLPWNRWLLILNYFQFTIHHLLHTVSVQLIHHYVSDQIIYPSEGSCAF
jgi:hypothetical protein